MIGLTSTMGVKKAAVETDSTTRVMWSGRRLVQWS